jgi:hypothetical protein
MRVFIGLLAFIIALALLDAREPGAQAASDQAASLAAFQTMLKVLNHPRCMNCHTTADWPTQGDDRHRHTFNVTRGPSDRGPPGMTCTTCHKDTNLANVPGAKDWHMAPITQGWTDLAPGALCRLLLDPKRNGGRTGAAVIEHVRGDRLVLWAWSPGGTRTKPPLAHKDFLAAAETWIMSGAHCPKS